MKTAERRFFQLCSADGCDARAEVDQLGQLPRRWAKVAGGIYCWPCRLRLRRPVDRRRKLAHRWTRAPDGSWTRGRFQIVPRAGRFLLFESADGAAYQVASYQTRYSALRRARELEVQR